MVTRFMCKGSGSYMEHSKVGYWVSLEDYVKLRRLLKVCAENLSEYVANTRGEMNELEEAVEAAKLVWEGEADDTKI
jgi:hypothetical protein